MGIVYLITVFALILAFILVKKTEKKQDIISFIRDNNCNSSLL